LRAAEGPQWRQVTGPPALSFPRDHGAHPGFRTEWWYLTANLQDAEGRRYGVQLTFFRYGLDPSQPKPVESPLRTHHALAAHLAVAEIDGERFRHAQRVSRADGAFAGFGVGDLGVWIGNWTMDRADGDVVLADASDRESGLGVALRSRPSKPVIPQGTEGYSQKGNDPGNASAYVSWTRLEIAGTLTRDGREVDVTGSGWFDHEWGSSQLGEGIVGWDWFSMRFADRSELMVYQLRRADGSAGRFSSGTLVSADGSTRRLAADDIALRPTGGWTSPESGGVYPSEWQLRVEGTDIDVRIRTLLADCEVDGRASTGVVYWEGPVAVSGSHIGEGYGELTGYAGSLAGRF
jgi:predicted secreted hydrolase